MYLEGLVIRVCDRPNHARFIRLKIRNDGYI